jgi:hypothetical protein
VTAVRDRPWAPPAALLVAIVAYAVVATRFDPFTWPMRIAVGLASFAVLVLAVRAGWGSGLVRTDEVTSVLPSRGAPLVVGLAVWVLLLAVLTVFQLAVFTSNPRHTYPTLSSLANATFQADLVRIAAFSVWFWVGWYLVRR